MKQTAVEFISKGLFDILQEAENNNILEIGTQNFKRYIEMFEKQAKAMEKEQSECICVNVIEMILDESEQGKEINSKEIFEKCYKEIFKSE